MMPSFRLDILGSLAREVAAAGRLEQGRGLDATALGKAADDRFLKAVLLKALYRPVVGEKGLEGWWGRQGWRRRIVVV